LSSSNLQTWDLWYPEAAATGMSFARSRIDPVDSVLVHAAPPSLAVYVQDGEGRLMARGANLRATGQTPILRLTIRDGEIAREDIWPGPEDVGCTVILPGGEAGILKSWWHADDHSEWRWELELYNHR
jgi:hypothetical protein